MRRRAKAILVCALGLAAACGKKAAPAGEPPAVALETRGQALAPPPSAASLPAPAASPGPDLGRAPTAVPSEPVLPSHHQVPPALRVPPLDELAFVPTDVEAVVRVDLEQVGVRSERPAESLRTLDFLLRAQQPTVWQILHDSGITAGKELRAVYLVLGAQGGARDATLVVGVGHFDAARLGARLRGTDAYVEPAPAQPGQKAAVFIWRHPSGASAGATETPAAGRPDAAAVGVADGLILFGPPDLVRRALAVRAGVGPDVRTSPLAADLLALDVTATVWGVAQPAAGPAGPAGPAGKGWLPALLPGVKRVRFQAALAAPGPDIDGLFTLRAEFASREQAAAFGDQLQQVLRTIAVLGERSPLGAGFARLRQGATLKIDDTIVVASAAL